MFKIVIPVKTGIHKYLKTIVDSGSWSGMTMCLMIYLSLRIFSFYFQPTTPLNATAHFLNTTLTLLIIGVTAFLLWKKNILGWYLVAAEIILGGTGLYLQAFGVSLRTLLLPLSLAIYFWQERKTIFKFEREKIFVTALLLFAILGAVQGWYFSNSRSLIIADLIPYLFLLYYFPLKSLLKDEKWRDFCFTALKAAVLGQAIFILFTYLGLLNGNFELQDAFYHWYRDIAGGKITHISFNFYRLVLNEQLLLIPAALLFAYKTIKEKDNSSFFYLSLLLFILSLNLTRIYFVALDIGLLVLFSRFYWKRWLKISLVSVGLFFVIFCSLFLLSSGGKSFGLEVFGLRLQSIVTPKIEDSSLSRMLLLPKIFEMIKSNPILGNGLGSSVTVYSPIFKSNITTPHFDWGYLEIITELGLIGFIIWLAFLWKIFTKIKKLPRWQLASFCCLLIINLTSPALFHIFGIIWLSLILAESDVFARQPVAPLRIPEQL